MRPPGDVLLADHRYVLSRLRSSARIVIGRRHTGRFLADEAVLVFPASGPSSETPLAWQAVADFPYRDFEGYAWHRQPGHQTAQVEPTASLLDYIVEHVAEASPSTTLSRVQLHKFAAAFARYHVGVAIVVGGYPGSEELTRV